MGIATAHPLVSFRSLRFELLSASLLGLLVEERALLLGVVSLPVLVPLPLPLEEDELLLLSVQHSSPLLSQIEQGVVIALETKLPLSQLT
jgi:hypothetical protein